MNKDNNFEEKLAKAIKTLPEHEPENSVWERIDAQLSFEKKLDNELVNLPEFDFEKNNWERIEKNLEYQKRPAQKIKIRKILVYSISAAAAIALFIGLPGIINKNTDIKITYTKEQVADNEYAEHNEDLELNPIKFLEQNCLSKAEICNSPEFKEQKAVLVELETERQKISETISAYGESPELVKSLIKIENLKSEILKDLIKTLNS